jgi:hypothetical protein
MIRHIYWWDDGSSQVRIGGGEGSKEEDTLTYSVYDSKISTGPFSCMNEADVCI